MTPRSLGASENTFTAADADDASAFFAFVDLAIGAVVTAACADDDGTLRVHFSDGCVITANPDTEKQAWHLEGRDGVEISCRPRGGLTVA